jgi:hypothetical protein
MIDARSYWENRVKEKGFDSVSTVGDIKERTVEEIEFLLKEIRSIYPEKVRTAIEFGAGWGRLLPVLWMTSYTQFLVDFVYHNRKLWSERNNFDEDSIFVLSHIKDICIKDFFDYAMTFFALVHILDEDEYSESVKKIINSVVIGGHLFIYESYNEGGETAPHCSNRNREQFLCPFNERCSTVKEIDWHSQYQPYETECHQPIRLFVFRRES